MAALRVASLALLAAGSQADGQLRGSNVASNAEPSSESAQSLEEPSQEQDDNPKQAMQGWDNESSSLQAAGAVDYWGNSFCTAHHVGAWCNGFTQVRCCRAS